MKKFAIVLSGCGVYDGAEIHESTLSMLAVARSGHQYQIFAPDIAQHHVINHLTGDEMNEERNVLIESARIARGNAKPLSEFDPDEYDAILFPGGFGAAKNLSDYAFSGGYSKAIPEVADAIKGMHDKNKPIGALCIAPVLLAQVLGEVNLTIGNDRATIKDLETLGAKHIEKTHGELVIDMNHKVVTTPCYMLDATITQIADGAENVVNALLKMM